jgi:hypothetical protein
LRRLLRKSRPEPIRSLAPLYQSLTNSMRGELQQNLDSRSGDTIMPRSKQLRAKAAEVLRAGRREAVLRNQPMCPFYRELALSYRRLANLVALTPPPFRREQLAPAGSGTTTFGAGQQV